MMTLQEMLEQAIQLPLEQQKMLANVLQHRCIEIELEREVIAQEAEQMKKLIDREFGHIEGEW